MLVHTNPCFMCRKKTTSARHTHPGTHIGTLQHSFLLMHCFFEMLSLFRRHNTGQQLNTMKCIEIQSVWVQEVEARASHFDCIAFAIFYPGHGTHNVEPFRKAFKGFGGEGA